MVIILFYLPFGNTSRNLFAKERIFNPILNYVIDGTIGTPALYGIEQLSNSLEKRGVTLVNKPSIDESTSSLVVLVGNLKESGIIKGLKQTGELELSENKESLAVKYIKTKGKSLLVISGADERGLMYALLDAARQVEISSNKLNLFDAIKEISERPQTPVRSMAVFLHNQEDEKEWYYSKEYWEEYFAMLAANRWNRFNLVFSHQTPYLAPMYPFHVKVDKYPDVSAEGLTEEQRKRNLELLRFISSLAKDRGIDFILGVWQQIAWGTGPHTRAQESMVSGYNEENMTDYTYLALKNLLRECPGISGLQLRLNYESGITYEGQTEFFRDAIFRASSEAGRPILLELRDIGLLYETLDAALATGLPTQVSHKYWAEDLIFPYHPTKFVWTYSYGDWLKYPRNTEHIYQVWSLGSHRLLTWGDPEFTRRFVPTTTFQDAMGFEICAPLSQKGFGNDTGAFRIFRDRDREYYSWEFERYWSYYCLFGRAGYNSETSEEIWKSELSRRFGAEATESIAQAYTSASKVVPLIAGVAISNFNQYVWPEKDMGGLINYFLSLRPFDRARFSGFQEYVDNVVNGRVSGKVNPLTVAEELQVIALETEQALDNANSKIVRGEKEFWATDMDFRILSGMARYFAQKIRAAIKLGFFYKTGDVNQLRQAIKHVEEGLVIWKNLASRAEKIYSSNLVFGPGSVGHWKDNIVFVEDDIKQLKYQEELFKIIQNADYAFDFSPEPFTRNTEVYSTPYVNNYTVERRFEGVFPSSRYDPDEGYGWIEGDDLSASEAKELSRYTWSGARLSEVSNIPGEVLMGDYISGKNEAVFRVDLPEGHYQGAVILTDKSPSPADHGPMEVIVVERFGERPILESKVIRSGESVIRRFNINMTGERFINIRLKFKADPGAHFIVNALTFTLVEPHITHTPVRKAQPRQSRNITVGVTLPPSPNDEYPLTSLGIITSNASTLEVPTEIVRVTLKYASGRGNEFKALEMQPDSKTSYSAVLPAEDMKTSKIRYYFEAEDNTGRVVNLPKANEKHPYFFIDVTDDNTPPSVTHSPVREHYPGQPLVIKAEVRDSSAISKVLLYYRSTRQTMEYTVLTMEQRGDSYVGTIPGRAISKDFDIMYYFEVFDVHANATLHPHPKVETPYYVVKIKR